MNNATEIINQKCHTYYKVKNLIDRVNHIKATDGTNQIRELCEVVAFLLKLNTPRE